MQAVKLSALSKMYTEFEGIVRDNGEGDKSTLNVVEEERRLSWYWLRISSDLNATCYLVPLSKQLYS